MLRNFTNRHRSLLTAVSLLAVTSAVSAQTQPNDAEQIEFSADQVTYNTENKTIKALGRVHLERDGYTLDAGEILYNEATGEMTASGAVMLVTPSGDKIYAPRMELEDNLKRAFIEDIRLLMTDGSQVRAASGARDGDKGETSLERAVYSPCKICEGETGGSPLWQIKAVKVVHNKEKRRLYYDDAVLEIFGLPVLWTPKFSHPDPTVDKASGVLPLDIKTTRNLGLYLGVPYHWVINDSQDLTVTPIVTTKEGLALGAEYRRNVGFGQFSLSGSITHGTLLPNNPDILDTAVALQSQKGIRGHIFSSGEFNHSKKWRSTYQFNWTSDDTYLRRYDISDADTLVNEYRLEGFYDRSYISLRTLAFQGLRIEDDAGQAAFALPLIDLEFIPKSKIFGGTPSFKANGLALFRTSGRDVQRLSLSTNWQRRWIASNGIVVDVDALVRADIYNIRNATQTESSGFTGTFATDNETETRTLARLSTMFSWPLVKYTPNGSHTVEPLLEVTVSPDKGPLESIVNEDSSAFELTALNLFSHDRSSGYDIWEDGSRLTYGVKWVYEGADLTTDVMFGQTWRIAPDFAVMAIGVGLEENFSNFVGRTTINYKGWLDLEHRYRLDESDFSFVRNDVDLTVGDDKRSIRIGYLKLNRRLNFENREDREEIRASGFYRITDNWKLDASFTKRLKGAVIGGVNGIPEPNGTVNYSIGASYENECVALGVTLRKNYTEDRDIRPGTSILFQLRLTNLG